MANRYYLNFKKTFVHPLVQRHSEGFYVLCTFVFLHVKISAIISNTMHCHCPLKFAFKEMFHFSCRWSVWSWKKCSKFVMYDMNAFVFSLINNLWWDPMCHTSIVYSKIAEIIKWILWMQMRKKNPWRSGVLN